MAVLEIFQNGNSMHPDTMGAPVYQIGTKNADGEYDVVVFDAMTEKEAKEKLTELRPVKAEPKKKPELEKKKPAPKKVTAKKIAPKKADGKKGRGRPKGSNNKKKG